MTNCKPLLPLHACFSPLSERDKSTASSHPIPSRGPFFRRFWTPALAPRDCLFPLRERNTSSNCKPLLPLRYSMLPLREREKSTASGRPIPLPRGTFSDASRCQLRPLAIAFSPSGKGHVKWQAAFASSWSPFSQQRSQDNRLPVVELCMLGLRNVLRAPPQLNPKEIAQAPPEPPHLWDNSSPWKRPSRDLSANHKFGRSSEYSSKTALRHTVLKLSGLGASQRPLPGFPEPA